MSDELQRDFGRLEGQVDSIEKGFDEFREEVREEFRLLREELRPVVTMANRVEGGWKTLAGVGAIASAVSAGVTSLIFKIKGGA